MTLKLLTFEKSGAVLLQQPLHCQRQLEKLETGITDFAGFVMLQWL